MNQENLEALIQLEEEVLRKINPVNCGYQGFVDRLVELKRDYKLMTGYEWGTPKLNEREEIIR